MNERVSHKEPAEREKIKKLKLDMRERERAVVKPSLLSSREE